MTYIEMLLVLQDASSSGPRDDGEAPSAKRLALASGGTAPFSAVRHQVNIRALNISLPGLLVSKRSGSYVQGCALLLIGATLYGVRHDWSWRSGCLARVGSCFSGLVLYRAY